MSCCCACSVDGEKGHLGSSVRRGNRLKWRHHPEKRSGTIVDSVSKKRAEMPEQAGSVLERRTLRSSNRRLSELLEPGMRVLDVGCGTGAITRGIAEAVGPTGRVVGADVDARLIRQARDRHGDLPWLSFETEDVYDLPFENEFDVVVAARVLQWLADPLTALGRMIRAAKPGGKVLVLDYNHEKIVWKPEPPDSMLHFYRRFLQWRADAGMNNAVADRLEAWFRACGLSDIRVTDQSEHWSRRDPGFEAGARIWADVAAGRGRQMVEDGYVTEEERRSAEEEYLAWVGREAQEMTMVLLAVEGTRAG
nr:methyltransferase domain-containing protein [Kallotenue papyrolyticum]